MTDNQKRKKAAIIAVAYYLQEEKANELNKKQKTSNWSSFGRQCIMNNSIMVQRKGLMPKN